MQYNFCRITFTGLYRQNNIFIWWLITRFNSSPKAPKLLSSMHCPVLVLSMWGHITAKMNLWSSIVRVLCPIDLCSGAAYDVDAVMFWLPDPTRYAPRGLMRRLSNVDWMHIFNGVKRRDASGTLMKHASGGITSIQRHCPISGQFDVEEIGRHQASRLTCWLICIKRWYFSYDGSISIEFPPIITKHILHFTNSPGTLTVSDTLVHASLV